MSEETYDFGGLDTESDSVSNKNPSRTLLDRLREVVEQEVRNPDIEVPLPQRPGVSVVFSPNVEQEALTRWRKQAGEGKKGGMDFMKFSTIIIGSTTEAILIDGEEVTDEIGNRVTFASPEVLEMTGESSPIPYGIKEFWASDPHLQATALKILDEAGWGEEAESTERENPTKG